MNVSLRTAAGLGLNALHECIVPKGAETQISDAMRALRSAIDADLSATQPEGFQARYRIPDGEWSSWRHVVCGVKGHEQELRVAPDRASPSRAGAVTAWPKDAVEVRAFFDPHCEVVQYAIDVKTPAEGDRYQLTAHDFLSAINWWADYHATPAATPLPAAVDVGAAPDTVPLPRKEWEELDYWLDRCESKGHLERCSDLIEPYEALCKAIAASATQQGATP